MKFLNKDESVSVTVSERDSYHNNPTAITTYISLTLRDKNEKQFGKIFWSGKTYTEDNYKKAFYKEYKINKNINLKTLDHGNEKDRYELNMKKFKEKSDKLNEFICARKKVLVNCNNGRSRSGAVIATYLIDHLNFAPEEAFKLVQAALEERGFTKGTSLNLKDAAHGSYQEWITFYHLNKPDGLKMTFDRMALEHPKPQSYIEVSEDKLGLTKSPSPVKPREERKSSVNDSPGKILKQGKLQNLSIFKRELPCRAAKKKLYDAVVNTPKHQ